MFSIRSLARPFVCTVVLIALTLAAAGCQKSTTPPAQAGNLDIPTGPIEQTRADWPRSTAYFANGDTVAGPTGRVYDPAGRCPRRQTAADVPVFLGNAVLLPWTLATTPGEQSHTGAQFEPTYTAIPPER